MRRLVTDGDLHDDLRTVIKIQGNFKGRSPSQSFDQVNQHDVIAGRCKMDLLTATDGKLFQVAHNKDAACRVSHVHMVIMMIHVIVMMMRMIIVMMVCVVVMMRVFVVITVKNLIRWIHQHGLMDFRHPGHVGRRTDQDDFLIA